MRLGYVDGRGEAEWHRMVPLLLRRQKWKRPTVFGPVEPKTPGPIAQSEGPCCRMTQRLLPGVHSGTLSTGLPSITFMALYSWEELGKEVVAEGGTSLHSPTIRLSLLFQIRRLR